MSLRININNEEQMTDATSISQLAVELQLPERGVALAVNNRVVPRTNWETTPINEGDSVTIIKAAFGG